MHWYAVLVRTWINEHEHTEGHRDCAKAHLVPLIRYLFPSQTAKLSMSIPKSWNDTHPVELVGSVSFPDPDSIAWPVNASTEPVRAVALHVEGTRQMEA